MTSVYVWGAMMLVLTGVMQWLVLRRQVPRAGWWIPASVAAHFSGIAVAIYTNMSFSVVLYSVFHSSELIGVAVMALITGAGLVSLLRQPAAAERTAAA